MSSGAKSKRSGIASLVVRILAAVIFLFPVGAIPKLTGDVYAVQLFEMMGVGDAGRYAVGAMELITAILLIVPKTAIFGAMLGVFMMLGAIGGHLTKLGIVVEFNIDGEIEKNPMLFGMAVANLALCSAAVYLNRKSLPFGKSSPKISPAT